MTRSSPGKSYHYICAISVSCSDSIIAVNPCNFRMTFSVLLAFMVGLDKKKTVDTDSSQASGLARRFQESMSVQRGAGIGTAVTLRQSVFYIA